MGRTVVGKVHGLLCRNAMMVPMISVNGVCIKELVKTNEKKKLLWRITEDLGNG
jgi:hypothetical protein